MDELYNNCKLCPRKCEVNRNQGEEGYCGETSQLKISSICAHHGEEPPISGIRGSGTVFFSGCSLKCIFCQNYQISLQGLGEYKKTKNVANSLVNLYQTNKIHNVNFVTPDHFFPHTFEIVRKLREKNIDLPILYNTSGYERISILKKAEKYADIYMPDFKYSDKELAKKLSHAEDYPEITLQAISEMVNQKGFLDSFMNKRKVATKGVLVRHLILPGNVQNSLDVLTTLFLEFGKKIPISLMSQYYPTPRLDKEKNSKNLEFLKRRITNEEFEKIYKLVLELGFKNIYIQYPANFVLKKAKEKFIPDFDKKNPFRGNK